MTGTVFHFLYLGFIGIEFAFMYFHTRKYPWSEFLVSAVLYLISKLLVFAFFAPCFALTINAWNHRLFTIPFPNRIVEFFVYFVVADFIYFSYHCINHRVRFLWAGHFIHHASDKFMLLTGMRSGFAQMKLPFTMLPIVYLGAEPILYASAAGLSLFFQFLLHTEAIGDIGPFNLIFNSPAQHRLHHARSGPSIDRNFAGVFLIFDRIAGTYVSEGDRELGIENLPQDLHPLRLIFFEWIEIFRDLKSEKGWKKKLLVLFGPPKAILPFQKEFDRRHDALIDEPRSSYQLQA